MASTDGEAIFRLVPDGSGADLDRIFSLLGAQRRRYVFYYLQAAPDPVVRVGELVTKIVDWEVTTDEDPSDDHLERVEIALQHHHLPKLDTHGLIDYDQQAGRIEYAEVISEQEWIEHARRYEIDH